MKFEESPQETTKTETEINNERVLSTEKMIKEGAKLVNQEGADPMSRRVLEVTPERIKKAQIEMAQDRRQKGDRYAAISIERSALRDDSFSDAAEAIIEALPEGLKKDLETIKESVDNGQLKYVEALDEMLRIVKPSFFSGKNNPARKAFELMSQPSTRRIMELNDEENLYWEMSDEVQKEKGDLSVDEHQAEIEKKMNVLEK